MYFGSISVYIPNKIGGMNFIANEILHLARREVVISDGGMGTMLQEAGLPPNVAPESWNINAPDVIEEIQREYANAGAQIITTNTFGASKLKLSHYGLADKQDEIIASAVKIARAAIGGRKIAVAGDIGPLGTFLQPFGEITFNEAYRQFYDCAVLLAKAGCDMLIIETMTELLEMKAAYLACRDATNIPIILTFAFDEGERSVTGTPPDVFAVVASPLGADCIGTNCGKGIAPVIDAIAKMRPFVSQLLIAQPNAGTPSIKNGRTTFPGTPQQMADAAIQLWELGVNVIGSCCGSTPEHTASIADAVRGKRCVERTYSTNFCVASRTKLLQIGINQPVALIGERINPSGRKKFREALKRSDIAVAKLEAIHQDAADALDICVSAPGVNEIQILPEVVSAVSSITEKPLIIDTTDADALQAALEVYPGVPVVNSISAKRSDINKLLPLVARWGASFIALTMDDNGIAKTVNECINFLKAILNAAEQSGISHKRMLADPVMLPLSAAPKRIPITLKAIKAITNELKIPTVIGLSNVSYGMPSRSLLNSAMLSPAIFAGLSAVIADPTDKRIVETISASQALFGRDIKAKAFIAKFALQNEPEEPKYTESLREDIIRGNSDWVEQHINEELNKSGDPLYVMNEIVVPAIQYVGKLYDERKIFLPQVIAAAEATSKALRILRPKLPTDEQKSKKILLATVNGDVHDIGKNLVRALLESHGFYVHDLGKNVPSDRIIEALAKDKFIAVGLSALMTTTLPEMRKTVAIIREHFGDIPIIVGGAAVSDEFATQIDAIYAKDAIEAARIAEKLAD